MSYVENNFLQRKEKMKKSKYILFLEGEKGTDYKKSFNNLKKMGFRVGILDELYENPNKLKKIKTINPDYLFIGTTGLRYEKREILIKTFKTLNYIPKSVIFFSERSAMAYLKISKELKKVGTKFFYSPEPQFGKSEIEEIEWI